MGSKVQVTNNFSDGGTPIDGSPLKTI